MLANEPAWNVIVAAPEFVASCSVLPLASANGSRLDPMVADAPPSVPYTSGEVVRR